MPLSLSTSRTRSAGTRSHLLIACGDTGSPLSLSARDNAEGPPAAAFALVVASTMESSPLMRSTETTGYNMLQPELSETETLPFNILGGMDTLAERIAFLRKEMGLTQEEFADAINEVLKSAGVQPVTRGAVGNWESGSKGIASRNLDAVAELADTTLDWLAKGRGPAPSVADLRKIGHALLGSPLLGIAGSGSFPENVPVYGQAAGSTLDEGALLLFDQDPIATLPMLPGLRGLRDVYALEVTGESMLPMFAPKDPVYVSPHSPVAKDDPVIIIEHRSKNGNPTAFIKLFVAEKRDKIVGRQLNLPAEIGFMKKPGVSVHKVLTMREAIGYSGVSIEPQTVPPLRFRRGPKR